MYNAESKSSVQFLLYEFCSAIIECVDENIAPSNALMSNSISDLLQKIEEGIDKYCTHDIEKEFKEIIRFISQNDQIDQWEFEAKITDLCSSIERLIYSTQNSFAEGLYEDVLYSKNAPLTSTLGIHKSTKSSSEIPTATSYEEKNKVVPKVENNDYTNNSSIDNLSDVIVRCDGKRLSVTIEQLDLTKPTFVWLKLNGIHTVERIIELTLKELQALPRSRNFKIIEVLKKLDQLGLLLKNTSSAEYIRFFLNCSLSDTSFSHQSNATEHNSLKLDVKSPQYDKYQNGTSGFTLYINIHNITNEPIKLKLNECRIYNNGIQKMSDYDYRGYSFSEGYIFPNSPKTFGKIWITDNWPVKRVITNDILTVIFENLNSEYLYYFKYQLFSNDMWVLVDCYELKKD